MLSDLHSVATLSAADFSAFADSAPLERCPRTASPDVAGTTSQLRRRPSSLQLERCAAATAPRYVVPYLGKHYEAYPDTFSTAASPSIVSSAEYDDDDEDDNKHNEEGIIWFGRREPPSVERVALFWAWVGRGIAANITTERTGTSRKRSGAVTFWSRVISLRRFLRTSKSSK
ncbi:uncharacterized protein LOC62_05G006960 [Vanrija pseudolonga]|uniref:Uncharacterized protein n=1 Tax=Vanrija pseudolonga TaxID=143232 RepID=A0AAF0YB36_9TREE|nr:hypothetical protein LOC62_05G006960 [Vanrija pseudolonga]